MHYSALRRYCFRQLKGISSEYSERRPSVASPIITSEMALLQRERYAYPRKDRLENKAEHRLDDEWRRG